MAAELETALSEDPNPCRDFILVASPQQSAKSSSTVENISVLATADMIVKPPRSR